MTKKMSIYQFLENLIKQICNNIPALFSSNELAYLTIQCKNEIQIRDRIAWKMQNELDATFPNQYLVRREWSDKSRSKVDLAVLALNSAGQLEKVIALIEFKAHSILNDEQWPYGEFLKDVIKMKKMCSSQNPSFDDETQMYFIYLHSQQDIGKLSIEYNGVINYYNAVQKSQVYNSCREAKMQNLWNEFFVNPYSLNKDQKGISKYKQLFNRKIFLFKQLQTPVPSFQSAGMSFGVEVFISPMIWGPYTAKDINVK